MTAFKYIVFETPDGIPTPVIFPPWLQHKDVASKLAVKPRSAGFLSRDSSGVVIPTGHSDSLDLAPHEDDLALLNP